MNNYKSKRQNRNTNDKDSEMEKRQTRSMDKALQKEKKIQEYHRVLDDVGELESFDDVAIYMVEIP